MKNKIIVAALSVFAVVFLNVCASDSHIAKNNNVDCLDIK